LSDIVVDNLTFKNCGTGSDWSVDDFDHHAIKVSGDSGGGGAYRIWVTRSSAVRGDDVDPVDGIYKSISGNFIQIGDENEPYSLNHHIYTAGCYQEYSRQALGWTKRSSDCLFSENEAANIYALSDSNGQGFGHQYAHGQYNWWINNVARDSHNGYMITGSETVNGPLFFIGNEAYRINQTEVTTGWRSAAFAFWAGCENVYVVNNLAHDCIYGLWTNNFFGSGDNIHVYNNIFSVMGGSTDTLSRAVHYDLATSTPTVYMENNLFDSYASDVRYASTDYATITDLNNQSWASSNIVGDPDFTDAANDDYSPGASAASTNAGTQSYNSGFTDVYQQYIDRYTDDPLYPGDPADYWPLDIADNPRVVGASIDIGPYEVQA
jgi:hypothetical protein